MPPVLRPLTPDDQARVLVLNEAVVHKLAPLDGAGYRSLLAGSAHAWAVTVEEEVAGFVIVFGPGASYESDNYQWFAERHESFWYLDRVAIDARFRRQGLASAVYDEVESLAAATGRPVLLEVNCDPPNVESLAFHAQRGFREMATLTHPGPKVVSLQAWYPPQLRSSGTDSSQ
jgi:predicted GNAT superfamily acetyltransferase